MRLLALCTIVGLAAAAPVHEDVVGRAVATPSIIATPISSVTVGPPASSATYAKEFPSSFPAPVQGSGKLVIGNLPALPPVLDKAVLFAVNTVYGLVHGVCNEQFKCSITVSGSIQDLLVDGNEYTASTTISAWCDAGRCYGSANPTITATAPFTITCDKVSGTDACSATISGLARAMFTNGQQLELWGWLTPSGYCKNGVCVASIDAFGDPMY